MYFDEFFPHQVCINLDRRPDRWERMQARFVEHKLNRAVRFAALDGETLAIPSVWQSFPGAYGCLRSHLAVVEQARANAHDSVLVFEDDAVLAPDFNAKFADFAGQLPTDWDMVFFGAIHGQPLTKVANNIIKVTHSLSTYAYALKHTIYDKFIEVNRQALTVLDENTRELQKQFNCYCFMPHLAWVEEDFSDVRRERIDLWWLKESMLLFGQEIEEILSNTVIVISYSDGNQRSLRNLIFTIDYLFQTLPRVTFLVLKLAGGTSLDRSDLPPYCRLESVEDLGCGNQKSRVIKRTFEMFGPSKEFFVFLESDIFLTRDDIKANLLKCREYDFASSFREIYDLNEMDTLRVLNGDLRWDYGSGCGKAAIRDSSFMVTRNGLRVLLEWEVSDNQGEGLKPASVETLLRVFESPNLARRLFSGRPELRKARWSIGIYSGASPFHLAPLDGARNPILASGDIRDVPAEFVADPFMIPVDGVWHMFFEVMNQQSGKGEIGLATSDDLLTWTYLQIVLAESFHLSYPYVFEWGGSYFMIPETLEAGAVRLYQAQSFPTGWSYLGPLIPGYFADPSIVHFDDRWWMFACPSPYEHNQLSLYFADDLMGPWTEHPDSPVVNGNKQSARPAGRVVTLDGKVVRFSQDCASSYGAQVRAFEISQLTTTAYHEVEHDKSPVLIASGSGWNGLRMHHLDPHCLPDGRWIACVDGLGKIVSESSLD
jgi:GR25 family glycosyltransferase involved in LPS biosynthesis